MRHGPSLLFYGDPQGHERLRAQLALMLTSTRGVATTVASASSQIAASLDFHGHELT
jgi:DNA-binding transcriptional MocR family regulator